MSKATQTAQQESQAHQLADDLRDQAAAILGKVAEILSEVPDEKLFGDTEFLVREQVLKLVATAFTTRLAQKKRLRWQQHRVSPLRTVGQVSLPSRA